MESIKESIEFVEWANKNNLKFITRDELEMSSPQTVTNEYKLIRYSIHREETMWNIERKSLFVMYECGDVYIFSTVDLNIYKNGTIDMRPMLVNRYIEKTEFNSNYNDRELIAYTNLCIFANETFIRLNMRDIIKNEFVNFNLK